MDKYTIFTYTVIRSAAEGFEDKVPYLTAILEDENGDRFTKIISGWNDGDAVSVGDTVQKVEDGTEVKFCLA